MSSDQHNKCDKTESDKYIFTVRNKARVVRGLKNMYRHKRNIICFAMYIHFTDSVEMTARSRNRKHRIQNACNRKINAKTDVTD